MMLNESPSDRPAARMRWPVSALVIWLLVVVAPVPFLAAGSSMGPHVLLLLMLGAMALFSGIRITHLGWLSLGSALLLLHFAVGLFTSPCEDSLGKSIASLAIMLPLVWSLALLAASHDGRSVDRVLRAVLVLVVMSVAIEKVYLVASHASEYWRPSGIYSEPSHLALSMAPALAALAASAERRNRIYGWGGMLILYALSASATLFAVVFMCLIFVMLGKPASKGSAKSVLRVLVVVLVSLGLMALSPYRDAFLERMLALGDVSLDANLSSVVYLHGWESALSSFDTSNGFGLGFNRMGCEPRPVTSALEVLEFFDLGDSNYNDGSFTFSKVLSEFGVLGLVWQFGLIVFMLRSVGRLRSADPEQFTWHAFLLGSVVVLSLGAFIRGTGYFSGPFLMGIWASFLLMRVKPQAASASVQAAQDGSTADA